MNPQLCRRYPFLIASLMLLYAASALAQPAPKFVWVQQAGHTAGDNSGRGISLDDAGNVYVTGYFAGTSTFGTTNLTARRNEDVFVAKYDSGGNVLWVRQAGGDGDFHGFDIAVDGSANAYVIGRFCCGTVSFGTNTLSAN